MECWKLGKTNKDEKLILPKTKSEWVWDIIVYTVFIAMVLFIIILWRELPEKVPAHFNGAGEVDRWGARFELWILPLVGLFTLLFLQIFERHPEMHNHTKRMNESNRAQFYLLLRRLINQVKNICLIIFAFITLESVMIAMEWGGGFGEWSILLLVVVIFLPIVIYYLDIRKIK